MDITTEWAKLSAKHYEKKCSEERYAISELSRAYCMYRRTEGQGNLLGLVSAQTKPKHNN